MAQSATAMVDGSPPDNLDHRARNNMEDGVECPNLAPSPRRRSDPPSSLLRAAAQPRLFIPRRSRGSLFGNLGRKNGILALEGKNNNDTRGWTPGHRRFFFLPFFLLLTASSPLVTRLDSTRPPRTHDPRPKERRPVPVSVPDFYNPRWQF